jgi:AcrR family transcriptional regulator
MDERRVASNAAGEGGTHPLRRRLDRRLARGDATRLSIMDATIDLIRSGSPQPTIPQIAARAEVSVRSVHHHFHGVETLLRCATQLQSERYRSLIASIPAHGPVTIRVRALCHQRRLLFEAIAPVLLANYLRTKGSPEENGVVAEYRELLRRQLVITLRPEILAQGPQARNLLDALDLATGWQSWLTLRIEGNRSPSAAEQTMAFWVSLLLS